MDAETNFVAAQSPNKAIDRPREIPGLIDDLRNEVDSLEKNLEVLCDRVVTVRNIDTIAGEVTLKEIDTSYITPVAQSLSEILHRVRAVREQMYRLHSEIEL